MRLTIGWNTNLTSTGLLIRTCSRPPSGAKRISMQNQRPNSKPTLFLLLIVLLLLAACSNETLFRSNFDATPVGQPPATMQAVGTAAIDGAPGSVIVIDPPVAPSGKWMQVSRPNGPSVSGFQGKFSQFKGDGEYTFSTTMFMT